MTLKDDIKVLAWLQEAFSASGVELKDVSMKKEPSGGYTLNIQALVNPDELKQALAAPVSLREAAPETQHHLEEAFKKSVKPQNNNAKEQLAVIKVAEEAPVELSVFSFPEAKVEEAGSFTIEEAAPKKKRAAKKETAEEEKSSVEITVEPLTTLIDEDAINSLFA